jgi:hypothetical protein
MPNHIMDPQIGGCSGMYAIIMPAARIQEMIVPMMVAITGELLVSPAYGSVLVTMLLTSP